MRGEANEVTIELSDEDMASLREMADADLRTPEFQAQFLVREQLRARQMKDQIRDALFGSKAKAAETR